MKVDAKWTVKWKLKKIDIEGEKKGKSNQNILKLKCSFLKQLSSSDLKLIEVTRSVSNWLHVYLGCKKLIMPQKLFDI